MFYQPQVSSFRFFSIAFQSLKVFVVIALCLGSCVSAWAQVNAGAVSQVSTARLRWAKPTGPTGPAGAARYRLQIAKDQQFNDVLFDGIVSGQEYVVTDLTPGSYYWRLTALDPGKTPVRAATPFQVRPNFANPISERPRVTPTPARTIPAPVFQPGWLAATGEITSLSLVQTRSAVAPHLLGVSPKGTVYALDAATGIASWIARTAPSGNSASSFVPLLANAHTSYVILLSSAGVRALDAATGREVWANETAGQFVGALAANLDSKASDEIYLSDAQLARLLILDAASGALLREIKLTKPPLGSPVVLRKGSTNQLLVPLRGDAIEVVSLNGDESRTIRTGGNLTTPPEIVQTSRNLLIVVGTRNGLAAFDGNSLAPVGRVVLDRGDYPIDRLTIAPSESSRTDTLAMITNVGRVVSVNMSDGKVNWTSGSYAQVAAPLFIDINGDGRQEILVASANSFATALSATDGSVVWSSASEVSKTPLNSQTTTSGLVYVKLADGRTFIVGRDLGGTGLRGMLLSRGIAPTAAN